MPKTIRAALRRGDPSTPAGQTAVFALVCGRDLLQKMDVDQRSSGSRSEGRRCRRHAAELTDLDFKLRRRHPGGTAGTGRHRHRASAFGKYNLKSARRAVAVFHDTNDGVARQVRRPVRCHGLGRKTGAFFASMGRNSPASAALAAQCRDATGGASGDGSRPPGHRATAATLADVWTSRLFL